MARFVVLNLQRRREMTVPLARPFPVMTMIAVVWATAAFARANPARVTSPDGQVEFLIAGASADGPAAALTYRVSYRGQPVILDSGLGLDFEDQPPLSSGL